jgi:23S rRNA pseudouridine1911/1915/1917 synthase
MSRRTQTVTRADARRTVAEWLHHHLRLSWNQARQLVRDGKVWIDDQPCRDSSMRLQKGQKIAVEDTRGPDFQSSRERPPRKSGRERPDWKSGPRENKHKAEKPNSGIVVRFVDEHIVVVEKPAGLTTMRHGHEAAEFGERGRRFLPATLEDMLPGLLPRSGPKLPQVISVHRLDKETSGLVVFARTPEAARHLGGQMRAHTAERRYIAVVRGQAKDTTVESWLVRDRGDGRRGSGAKEDGQRAVTHVHVMEQFAGFALVECKLETGRTHQVRIHLGEMGTPLCGERIYDRPLNGAPLPDGSEARRIMLHAATLDFEHPATGKRMRWSAKLPRDMKTLIERLRG